MVAFETDDLSALIKLFRRERVKIISGPVEMECGSHGMVTTITIEGPS